MFTGNPKVMWVKAKHQEELKLNQEVKVRYTQHEAKISKVVDKDEFGQELHCLCYHIEPRDPRRTLVF
jgi:hypothetical protein